MALKIITRLHRLPQTVGLAVWTDTLTTAWRRHFITKTTTPKFYIPV